MVQTKRKKREIEREKIDKREHVSLSSSDYAKEDSNRNFNGEGGVSDFSQLWLTII